MGVFDDVKRFSDNLRQRAQQSQFAQVLRTPVSVPTPVAKAATAFAQGPSQFGQGLGKAIVAPYNAYLQTKNNQTYQRLQNNAMQSSKVALQKGNIPAARGLANQAGTAGQSQARNQIRYGQSLQQAIRDIIAGGARTGLTLSAGSAGAPAIAGNALLGGGLNVAFGNKQMTPQERFGQGAGESVKYAGFGRLTQPFNRLTGSTNVIGKGLLSSGLNVGEAALYTKATENRNLTKGEFAVNALLPVLSELSGTAIKKIMSGKSKEIPLKINKEGFTIDNNGYFHDPSTGKFVTGLKNIQTAKENQLKAAGGGLLPKSNDTLVEISPNKYVLKSALQTYASDVPTPPMRVDRTKLTGQQLLKSNKDLTRLTPEQLLQADKLEPARMNNELKGVQAVNEFKASSLSPDRPTPVAQRSSELSKELDTVTPKLGKPNQSSPSDDIIARPLASQEIMGQAKNLKPEQKVNLLDYIRTPDRVLTKIGLGKEAVLLKDQYRKYVKELPQEINKITEWYKQAPDPQSAINIFKKLDGQPIELTPQEIKVAGEIKNYLSEWADKLGLPKDKRVASYITHLFEEDFIQKEFDPDIARLITDKVPGSVYDPFLQQRLGAQGYKENVWDALDAYVKRATRKYNMDPALEAIKNASKNVDVDSEKYLVKLGSRINLRPTELDNLLDNLVKSTVGYKFGQRPVANISRQVRQAVYRGTLGLNVGSAVRNLTQGVNTYAKLGEKYTIRGYRDMFSDLLRNGDELKRSGVLSDNIVQDRSLNATRKFWENTDKTLFSLFSLAERVNRGSAYFGAKAKALAQGLPEDQAIKQAIKTVEDTQFTFGSVDTPLALQSDLGKVFTQFQSFNVKQSEFLAEMIKNKNVAGLTRFAAANLFMMATVGKLFGMELKDIIPFSGVLSGETKLGQTPPVQGLSALGNIAFGDEEKRSEGFSNLKKTIPAFIPGGVQGKKTIEGVKAYNEGASLTPTGRTRFEVPKTPVNAVKTAVFGQYSTPEAKTYFKNMGKSQSEVIANDFKKLKTKEEKSKLWQQYTKEGKITQYNRDDVLKSLKDVKLKTTDKEKTLRGLPVKDGSRARQIKKQFDKLKTREEKSALWKKYTDQGIITKEVREQLLKIL